ncbi:MAG: restriction endonuclease [Kofleriaceae bacterium]
MLLCIGGSVVAELTRLSDHDFELLARDLLSAELGVRLESFARGRDKGIDLRYLAPPSTPIPWGVQQVPDIVVQCKHYAGTGYSGLKSKLQTKERTKVAKLSPKRYILVTSVDLTAANKTELRAILAPYVQTESDIYGASDIDGLLKRHPTVERSHFKLWLTSSEVLDRFLHSETYRHTEHVLKNIERNAVRYVANASYPAAKATLTKNHVCVIAGRAGIGKTTLAEMLLLEHTAAGFQPIVVSADASEANGVWNDDPGVRQIFYYDDFLGQAAVADKLNKNEDARLDVLLGAVIRTKNKRLILTTREYILEQAKRDYERLERMGLEAHKHVIRLEDYTRLNKAQILYNHLYFSELDADVRASLLPQKVYLKVINHENYTPRLIDDIARRAKLDGTTARDFPGYFVGILDDPKTLWQHTFDNSISAEARLVLLSLASLPPLTTISALRAVYDALQSNATAKPFFYALKEVDGDFLRTTQSGALTVVSFFNPSVRDFVLARLWESVALRDRLLGTVPFFEQVLALNQSKPGIFGGQAFARALVRTLASGGCVVIARGEPRNQVYELSVMNKVARLAFTLQHASAEVTAERLSEVAKGLAEDWSEGYFSGQGEILRLIELIQSRDPGTAATLVEAVRLGLRDKEIEDIDDAEFARDFMNTYYDEITDEDREIVGELAESFVNAEIEHLLELKDPEEIRERFSDLETLADDLGNVISHADGRRIEERIEQIKQENEHYDDWDGDRSGEYQRSSGADENAAIDDLFDSMERD